MIKNVLFLCVVSGLVVVAACKEDEPEPRNGVNSVRLACDIRTAWARSDDQECIDCLSISRAPKCGCPEFSQEYAGACGDQGTAFGNERNCDLVGECTGKCPKTDCACLDACYNDRPACRPRAAALDGCTTDVCDKYCR